MKPNLFAVPFAALFLALVLGGGLLASADPARADENTVVARIGEETITLGDVKAAQAMMPEQVRQAPIAQVYDIVLSILIDSKLAARDAIKRGLDKDVDIARQLARVREQILERAALSRHIDQQITEDAVRARHQKAVAAMQGQKEMRVSHILLENRADAQAVIADLQAGGDFAALAKERSIGPSAAQGGDIGFIGPGDTVAPFQAAAFALKEGAFSAAPVQTQFGWHVILAGEKRARAAPTLDQVRDRIVASLSREIGLAYVQSLRQGATIERFAMDGKPQQ